jgi:Mg2+ and Co2+ transporter CorA
MVNFVMGILTTLSVEFLIVLIIASSYGGNE